MIVSCPSCATRYVVDPQKIGPNGRRVKCAACGHVWKHFLPASDKSPEPGVPPPGDAATGTLPAKVPEKTGALPVVKPRRRPALRSWGLLFLAAAAAFVLAAGFRESIVAAVPGAQRLYEFVGWDREPWRKHFELRDFEHYRRADALSLQGEVTNSARTPVDAPWLTALFLDSSGDVIGLWHFPPPKQRMFPGETVRYSTRAAEPPGTRSVDIVLDPENAIRRRNQ